MRLAIIGSSGHYPVVLEGLSEQEEMTICAIAPGCREEDITPLAEACAENGHAPAVWEDWKEMLSAEQPGLAVINSWFGKTADMVCWCLYHGIPVYAEKPLAASPEELVQVRRAWEETTCPLGVMLTLRYEPWFLTMQKAVEAGQIGDVRLIHAQKSYKLGWRPEFFQRRKDFTGLIPWVGIHAVDWAVSFGGKCVQAMGWHTTMHNRGMHDMEMTAVAMLRFTDDAFATISVDYLRPDGAARHDDDRLRLTGTLGTIEAVDGQVYLEDRTGPRRALPLLEGQNPFAAFLHLLQKGETAGLTQAGIEATRIALALREAADTGKIQEV